MQADFTGTNNFIIPTIEQPKGFSARGSPVNDDIFIESESSYRPPPVANQQKNIAKEIKNSIQSLPAATVPLSTLSVAPSPTFSSAASTFTNAPSTFSYSFTTTQSPPTTVVKTPSKYYTPPFLDPPYQSEKDDNFLDAPKNQERRQLDSSLGLPNEQKKYEFQAFDGILKAVRKASREDYDFSKYVRNNQQDRTKSAPKAATAKPTVKSTVRSTAGNRFNSIQSTLQSPTGFRLPQTVPTTRAPVRTTTTKFTTRPVTTTKRPTTTTRAPVTVRTSIRPSTSQLAPRIGTAPKPFVAPAQPDSIPIPSAELLPPFEEFSKLDSVTLGPPIYYEWKANIPSIDLLPPLEDNDQLDVNSSGDVIGAHSQTTRSISEQSLENSFEKAIKKLLGTNYSLLKKELSIPEYQFPLEGEDARTGYERKEAVNSFQIKIPNKRVLEWYGENPNCPECHPSFVKPGTCEPCVKIRE